jgi:integrase
VQNVCMSETPRIRDQKAVTAALRRGPGVTRDSVVGGLMLVLGRRKASWQLSYIPHGLRADGKRHGRVQMAIGDAMLMSLPQARAEARSLKAVIAKGEDPHRRRRAAKVANALERANAPTTLAEAAAAYALDLSRRATPSLATRKQETHYSRKALALMGVEGLAANELGAGSIRRLLRETNASPSELAHLFGALSRFCDWMIEERIVEANPCAAIPRKAKPTQRSRDYTPSIEEIRAVWAAAAAEEANVRDVIHLLILAPLRLREMTGLRWGEVDLVNGWLRIPASRMKTGIAHDMPLSDEAHDILRRRLPRSPKPDDLVLPSSRNTPIAGWSRVIRRIRKALGQSAAKNPDDPTRRAEVFSWHDLRRGLGTHCSGQFDEHLLNIMLAHKPASRAGAGAAYLKATRMKERPAVVAAWAALVLGNEVDSNVLQFPLSAETR